MRMQRRTLLAGAAALGLHARLALAAAGPAQASGPLGPDSRLVVVMLRGALDGLAAVPAVGDPAWHSLRPSAAGGNEAPLPLDNLFALHPRLATLHRWWQDQQLLVVHAVAQPYRERSHFDAQQLLESGGARPFELHTGWLGRALEAAQQPGLALLGHVPLALRGNDASGRWSSNWAPARDPEPSNDFLERAQRLYADDTQLSALWARAMAQQGLVGAGAMGARDRDPARGPFSTLASQAGRFLGEPAGPRLAWLELDGWDTHTAQAPRLQRALATLDDGLAALQQSLGPHWARTSVLVMTEFGRSAVPNGTNGTDHGTGGVAFLAGGAVRGGRVLADWPGLAPGQLWQARDLRPTLDLRSLQRAVLEAHWALPRASLEHTILPGAPAALPDLYSLTNRAHPAA